MPDGVRDFATERSGLSFALMFIIHVPIAKKVELVHRNPTCEYFRHNDEV